MALATALNCTKHKVQEKELKMTTLYRTPEDPAGDRIEKSLEEYAIAYDCVVLSMGDAKYYTPGGEKPPVFADDGTIFEGEEEILAHIRRIGILRRGILRRLP